MAKCERYLLKLDSCKTCSMTGMRLKMAMYNAVRACYAENVPFPYQCLLERYCIPGKEDYLDDRKYYKIFGNKIVESERSVSETEQFLGKLAAETGGRLVYGKCREPMAILDGMVITASQIKKDTFFTDDYVEDFSVPFDLYPRVINVVNGMALIEIREGVTEWTLY